MILMASKVFNGKLFVFWALFLNGTICTTLLIWVKGIVQKVWFVLTTAAFWDSVAWALFA